MSIQTCLELTASVAELEECDLAVVVADEAVLGGGVVDEAVGRTVGAIGADPAGIVSRVKHKVLVLARTQHPVVLE